MKLLKRWPVLCLLIISILFSGNIVQASPFSKASPKGVYLILHRRDGQILYKTPVKDGKKKLPGMKNPRGYTFLGWSTKKGQSQKPKYYANDVIRVKKTTHLYPVFFNRKKEADLEPWELPPLDLNKYSKIIFVGDSRTHKMRQTLLRQCDEETLANVEFVAKSGKGLDWFRTVGYPALKKKIADAGHYTERKPVAIVFNLGVNDIRCSSSQPLDCKNVVKKYICYFNKLGQKLKARNCKLFYMSINPHNQRMVSALRKDEDVRYFNASLKNQLGRHYTYLDTYTRLAKYGYSTNNDVYDDERDDGLHYSMRTYKRIYRMCMEWVNRG